MSHTFKMDMVCMLSAMQSVLTVHARVHTKQTTLDNKQHSILSSCFLRSYQGCGRVQLGWLCIARDPSN